MIFKILLVAALFVTATMAWPKHIPADNPGCICGPNIYKPALVSTLMNRARNAKADNDLGVGTKTLYPRKFANTERHTFELCTGVAADDIHEYPLRRKRWKHGESVGKYFLIFDAKENKFCGCAYVMFDGWATKCRLGTGNRRKEGPGESSNPVHNPLAGPVPRVGRT